MTPSTASSRTSTTPSTGSSRRRTAMTSRRGTTSSARWVRCAWGARRTSGCSSTTEMRTGPERWREFYGDRRAWVFTHERDLPVVVGADIRFVQGDVRPVYDEMRSTRDGDVWIIGGGDLVGQFDDAGLLDRVILGMCPVTLGAGAPAAPPPHHVEADAGHRRAPRRGSRSGLSTSTGRASVRRRPTGPQRASAPSRARSRRPPPLRYRRQQMRTIELHDLGHGL